MKFVDTVFELAFQSCLAELDAKSLDELEAHLMANTSLQPDSHTRGRLLALRDYLAKCLQVRVEIREPAVSQDSQSYWFSFTSGSIREGSYQAYTQQCQLPSQIRSFLARQPRARGGS